MKNKLNSIVLCICLIIIALVFILFCSYNNKKLEDKIKEENNSSSRIIAVSINNHHSAWPHSGLQDAFLCYELIAEGGITRILAFYKDANTSKIGSVRSVRHYFLDYVLENDAIIVHYGFSPQAKEDINTLKINNINGIYDNKTFYRDKTLNRNLEHTAFTSMDRIKSGIKRNKYRNTSEAKLLNYSDKIYINNKYKSSAKNVIIKYSNYQTTSYIYDEKAKAYKLYMNDIEQTDLVTGKTYTVKNIITYQIKNVSLNDSKGRQNLENIGEGYGYYISEGNAVKIKWIKKSRESKTNYFNIDGTPLIVNNGNTWIHIQPKNNLLKIY